MTDTELALKFVRVGKIARRVPRALLDQKKKFIESMKLKQIRNAKATIAKNKERLREESKESEVFKDISKSRLL